MIKIQQTSNTKVHNLNSSTQCNTKSSRLLLFVVMCGENVFKFSSSEFLALPVQKASVVGGMGPWEYCQPLLRHREPYGFSRDKRRWPMIFSALLTTFWSAFLSAAGTSHTRIQCSDALCRALTQALGARGECPLVFWESPVSEQQLEPATDWRSWQRPLAAKPSAASVPWPLGWWPSMSASPRAPPLWGWGCWCESTSKWAKKLFCQHQRRGYYCAS